jgi:hypothetical protein
MHCKVYIIIPSDVYYTGVDAIVQYVEHLMRSRQFIYHIEYPYSYDSYDFGGRYDGLMKIFDQAFESYEYYHNLKEQERVLDNCARIDRYVDFMKSHDDRQGCHDLFTLDQSINSYNYEDFLAKLTEAPHEYIAYIDYHC